MEIVLKVGEGRGSGTLTRSAPFKCAFEDIRRWNTDKGERSQVHSLSVIQPNDFYEICYYGWVLRPQNKRNLLHKSSLLRCDSRGIRARDFQRTCIFTKLYTFFFFFIFVSISGIYVILGCTNFHVHKNLYVSTKKKQKALKKYRS